MSPRPAWSIVRAAGWYAVTDGVGQPVLIGHDITQAETARRWLNHYASREG